VFRLFLGVPWLDKSRFVRANGFLNTVDLEAPEEAMYPREM
jgi:hypothetical protein